jgi:hypothetical protein
MSIASSWLRVFALALLPLLVPGTARAHSRASRRHEPVALRLHVSEANINASVETADKALGPKGRVVLSCKSVCDTQLPRGRYQLILRRDGETSELDSKLVNLQRPLQFNAKAANTGLRTLGLSLLITGGIAVAGGFVAIGPNLLLNSGCSGQDNCERYIDLARVGYVAAAGGGVLVLVGTLLYWGNRSSFKAKRLTPADSGLSVRLIPTTSGIGGIVTGRF